MHVCVFISPTGWLLCAPVSQPVLLPLTILQRENSTSVLICTLLVLSALDGSRSGSDCSCSQRKEGSFLPAAVSSCLLTSSYWESILFNTNQLVLGICEFYHARQTKQDKIAKNKVCTPDFVKFFFCFINAYKVSVGYILAKRKFPCTHWNPNISPPTCDGESQG